MYTIRQVTAEKELQDALHVRRVVFIEEQQVPEDLEIDEYDQLSDPTIHVVAYRNNEPVATGRLRSHETGVGKIERVAVKQETRGTGLGRDLMNHMEKLAVQQGYSTLKLSAQLHAQPFYEKLGYVGYGEIFDDAGIDHIMMKKQLNR
ncbi:GNAT family N-acetyltransferase [Brevibacillus laterosporus]|uniref:GNAT family N-acetyltransferase n=1 Tax=Brevibacillus laterosporus TaxID=1465 RepID=UPI000CE57958|nr:GNAT family N-acetyltransferase [Brevibacillus laterosporus]MED1663257.1 GNAT family N-acetyltransferase [Brevibacillus laterosporus]MED1669456.1 GNAT family N-acetyltransferase [Brevibacillus laterosporus]MED1717736.1 GNAT family N-acetyltransferase [Brevibacillus laterosporus]PPA84461.1 GNAT family N-acetyltransferase [Brevibacillus laterosporus]